jgi:hypothetical protein
LSEGKKEISAKGLTKVEKAGELKNGWFLVGGRFGA